MYKTPRKEEEMGAVLVKVQDDLKQLKRSLDKVHVNERGKILDIRTLDTAIQNTESSIRKHAEDYLKTVTKRLLVLPSIEDVHKTAQIPKWNPPIKSIPDKSPPRKLLPMASPVKKIPSAIHLLYKPSHSKNRSITHQKCEISFPDVHKKRPNAPKLLGVSTGPVACFQAIEQKGHHSVAKPEKDTGMGLLDIQSRCKKLESQSEPGSPCNTTGGDSTPLWNAKTPPPSTNSKSMDQEVVTQDQNMPPESPESQPAQSPLNVNVIKYPFTIINGRVDPMAADFLYFKQSCTLSWGSVVVSLEAVEKLLRDFAVPLAKVIGEQLVELGHNLDIGWRKVPPVTSLISVLENWEEVLNLVLRPGQRYKGEGGTEAAAIRIQSCWRRHVAQTAYLCHCRRKWAVETIAISWWMHMQIRRVRKALQARRFRQLENYRRRAQHLATNWKHIQSSKRTIIHIPSLGYSQRQRLNLRGFDILQNTQISRLCDIRDENVEVIYVCPRHLEEDILHYYTSLLKGNETTNESDTATTEASSGFRRFIILTPEALDYFPTNNMCLSTLLKYSPHTLKHIKNLIQGKEAYIVGRVAHMDDLAVADELEVPLLGPEPAIAQLYSTKTGGRRIFMEAEVDVPPGRGDIYSLNQLHETLAELMVENMDVQRWVFKMNSEFRSHGTAYCDKCYLSCYNWALQEYHHYGPQLWKTKWIQESVLLKYLDEIPEWLARYARPVKTSCYPNWACFLKTFLRQGGVVEAHIPSDSITCLRVDLLLEPGGEVTMLSCGDQLHASCQREAVGSTVPQTSVHPETLNSICTRVGQACLRRHIIGYVSVDLVTFLSPDTMEQKVWAIDLDLAYSDQLAMTQMLLMITGGTLNFHTGCLEVPIPITEKSSEHQIAPKPPVLNCYAVIGIHLFHSNLSMLYHYVFLKICKTRGIGFDIKRKQGTVFALYDSSDRCSIGMMTVSEDLQRALVTFARNLSVIHQEISSSKIQGETNFKALIKNIEDVLQMTAQNKLLALEDKLA